LGLDELLDHLAIPLDQDGSMSMGTFSPILSSPAAAAMYNFNIVSSVQNLKFLHMIVSFLLYAVYEEFKIQL
jgi:hypothetical protein